MALKDGMEWEDLDSQAGIYSGKEIRRVGSHEARERVVWSRGDTRRHVVCEEHPRGEVTVRIKCIKSGCGS